MNQEQIEALANQQAEHADYTKEVKGGDFEKTLPVDGMTVLRFREYIELGVHKTATPTYPNKKPAPKARFVFELVTPKHTYTVGEGEDAKTYRHTIAITVPISPFGKSNYMKLFKQLNWAGSAKVPAQLLGTGYMAEIVHAYDKADLDSEGKPNADAKPKWANLQKDGTYTFQPPRIIHPTEETVTEVPVADLLGAIKLFLWDYPNQESWDSLFIDGEYTKEVDGKEVTKSKNYLQNMLIESNTYEGSLLQELIIGGNSTLEDLPTGETPSTDVDPMDAILGTTEPTMGDDVPF